MIKKFVPIGIITLVLMAGSFWAGTHYQNNLLTVGTRLNFDSLNTIYALLQNKFDGNLDPQKLLDGAKAGLVGAAGDPYTVYLDTDAAKALGNDLSGTLSGIGAEIAIKNSKLTVVAPIADSPAAKAGLLAGDNILQIGDTNTSTLTLEQAVAKIRGPKDSQVKLKIARVGKDPFDLTITRDTITVASVKSSMKPGNIGYIQVVRFGSDTASKFDEAARDLRSQGATKVIVDLRNNPGGYLDAAVSLASEFMEPGKLVVEERKGDKSTDKLKSQGDARLLGLPTVVLINSGSASASEILAGALQDYKLATLIGERSFGKGSVQEIASLGGGTQLKVTIAHWYTPNGKNISKEGIAPDKEVKLEQADYDASRDPQLDAALQFLK